MKKTFKKIFLVSALVMLLSVLFCFSSSALAETGECGDNATWRFNAETGELVISGTGELVCEYCIDEELGDTWSIFRENDQIRSLVIEEGITKIKTEFAFYCCENLASVSFPDSMIDVGYQTFYGTAWLNNLPDGVVYAGKSVYLYKGNGEGYPLNVTIKEGTVAISQRAFANEIDLTGITIPDSVTYIGASAFSGTDLKELTIPDSVTYIGYYAFDECSDLETVTIGKNVNYIGDGAFDYCEKLTDITLPDSVTYLGGYAFRNCTNLTTVKLSEGLTTVRGELFSGCKKLSGVAIPKGVTEIHSEAFYNCDGLTDVVLPENVTFLGRAVFAGCDNLKNITLSKKLKIIDEDAFEECEGLTAIVIPDSIEVIEQSAFSYCFNLINVEFPEKAFDIGSSAFYETAWYDAQPDGIVYAGKTAYGWKNRTSDGKPFDLIFRDGTMAVSNAFGYSFTKMDLVNLIIPDSMELIGDEVFCDCHNLESVKMGKNVKYIGESAFEDCSSLKNIEIPAGVTVINERTFYNCYALSSVSLGNNITSIGERAFYDCKNLENITIPDSVNHIGDRAFYNCFKIKDVTIPDGLTSIGEYVFYDCSLTNLKIPENVTSIGQYAFYKCEFKEITIHENVTEIGYRAFGYCPLLEITVLSKTADLKGTEISSAALIKCYKNSSAHEYAKAYDRSFVLMDGTDEESIFSGTVGKFTWKTDIRTGVLEINGDGFLPDFGTAGAPWKEYGHYITKIVFSEGFTDIGGGFDEYSRLRSVSIPGTVTFISDDAFKDCDMLNEITIPESVTSIGESAFENCTNLTGIVIPKSVERIGDYAFENCSSLSEAVIEDGVKHIGYMAFDCCKSLKSITIPESVYYLGPYAFRDCHALTSATVSGRIGRIRESTFSYCDKLETVNVGNGITKIDNYAFHECANLRKIIIPESVIEIDYMAFYGCRKLSEISLPGGLQSFGGAVFEYCTSLTSIAVPHKVKYLGSDVLPTGLKEVMIYGRDCEFAKDCGLNYTHTIYGYKDSTAQIFAEEIGAHFEDLEAVHTHSFAEVVEPKYCSYTRCICGRENITEHVDADKDIVCDVCKNSLNEIEVGVPLTVIDRDGVRLKFTALKPGVYTFKVDGDFYGEYYTAVISEYGNEIDSSYRAQIMTSLEKGQTVYWCF